MYWLADVLMRLRNIDASNLMEPDDQLRVGDVLVGKVNDDEEVKKMFHLFCEISEWADSLKFAHNVFCPPTAATQATHDDLRTKYLMALQESITIYANLQYLLRRKFPAQLADKSKVFLRENWQVVYTDNKLPEPMLGDVGIAAIFPDPGV